MTARIGLMGGTFDPIHIGHLVAADETRHALSLDSVVFVPAGDPWQKRDVEVTPAELRFEMVKLAVAGNDAFEVSRIEIDRTGPTYTVDTLRDYKAMHGTAELFFITGADAIAQILTWKDADEALGLATFVAVTRPGHDLEEKEVLDRSVRDRVKLLEIPALAISSSDIRARVAAGRPIRYLVPERVAGFVSDQGLYLKH